jgi:hypothetical protein
LRSGGLVVERTQTTYANTYLYLVIHHLTRVVGRPMPSTSRTRGSGSIIDAVEAVLRWGLAPANALAYLFDKGAEVVAVARRVD